MGFRVQGLGFRVDPREVGFRDNLHMKGLMGCRNRLGKN